MLLNPVGVLGPRRDQSQSLQPRFTSGERLLSLEPFGFGRETFISLCVNERLARRANEGGVENRLPAFWAEKAHLFYSVFEPV